MHRQSVLLGPHNKIYSEQAETIEPKHTLSLFLSKTKNTQSQQLKRLKTIISENVHLPKQPQSSLPKIKKQNTTLIINVHRLLSLQNRQIKIGSKPHPLKNKNHTDRLSPPQIKIKQHNIPPIPKQKEWKHKIKEHQINIQFPQIHLITEILNIEESNLEPQKATIKYYQNLEMKKEARKNRLSQQKNPSHYQSVSNSAKTLKNNKNDHISAWSTYNWK